ncbi:MAG: CidA/LrgA family protein [Steroidobacteraceae bacterium]
MKRLVEWSTVLEIGLVLLFWGGGWALVHAMHLPFSAGLAGLLLLLAVLVLGWMPLARIRNGSQWLLTRMLVFFVPAVLAALDYPQLFGLTGLKILFVIIISTAAVMASTGAVVYLAHRLRSRVRDAS